MTTVDPILPVSASMIGSALHFRFSLPRGHDGTTGTQDIQGDTEPIGFTGADGIQGLVGGVSQAALDAGIASVLAGRSGNSNGVGLLNLFVSDPPTQSESRRWRTRWMS